MRVHTNRYNYSYITKQSSEFLRFVEISYAVHQTCLGKTSCCRPSTKVCEFISVTISDEHDLRSGLLLDDSYWLGHSFHVKLSYTNLSIVISKSNSSITS